MWSTFVTRILGRSAGNEALGRRSGLGSNQEQQSRHLVWMLERWWRKAWRKWRSLLLEALYRYHPDTRKQAAALAELKRLSKEHQE